jgi:arsenite-transporting ATPase
VIPKDGTRFPFFSGKGGVGKTTMAAATAVWLADQGYNTLVVSTDLQKSLNDIFQRVIDSTPTPIRGVPNLKAVSIETAESITRHRSKMIRMLEAAEGPDSPLLKQIRDAMQSECGCAQAALFEFVHFLNSRKYQAIVFDTAPTGHTLEQVMNATNYALWLSDQLDARRKLVKAYGGQTALEEQIRALEEMKREEERAIENLRGEATSFLMVMVPEAMPLMELERNIPALEEDYRIPVRGIIINSCIPESEREASDFWRNRWAMQKKYIDLAYEEFSGKVIAQVPLLETEVLGIERLRRIGEALYG